MQKLHSFGFAALALLFPCLSFGQPQPEPPAASSSANQMTESSAAVGSTSTASGFGTAMTGAPGAPLGYPYEAGASSGTVVSIEAGAPEPAAVIAASAEPPQITGDTLVDSISREPIDFDFTNTDILTILRTIAVKFNRNIIAAPDVGGKVTLHIHKVPFDEAFRTLLDQLGLVALQKSSKVIKIIKAAEMPYLVQVYKLKHRFAQELQSTLVNMLKGKEKEATVVTIDLASNSIVVTSTNEVLQKIKSMVEQLDIASPQITVKARIIEIQADSDLKWGVAWANVTTFGKGGKVQGLKDANNFIPADAAGNPITKDALNGFPLGGVLTVSSVLNKTQLYGIINALKSDNHTKTISEPMILTGNNKSSKIHVGQNLPVVTSQVTLTATTQGVQYIPEGVDLDVTPIVSPGSDVIAFKIRVTVSELVGFQNNNPITSERTAQTEVSIESGKTVVIGGLMKDSLTDSNNGIPILKDIPLLGYFFKTRHKQKNKTELLIFITPELLVKPR